MIYLDTSLVISYADEKDPNHDAAKRLVERLGGAEKAASRLVLVELASVYARAGLEKPLELALYSIELAGARLVEIDFSDTLKQAYKLAPLLRLRTLDLLHIAACLVMKATKLATLDQQIIQRSHTIKSELEIEIAYPEGIATQQ
ncbi:MAG: PIN domain-containing protein [Aigarchaeota archaeon]|nr:PIN domain-containing protein [Candidatus Pelearchaeum maunauluense]